MAWILPSVTSPPLASSGLRLRTSWVVLPSVVASLELRLRRRLVPAAGGEGEQGQAEGMAEEGASWGESWLGLGD